MTEPTEAEVEAAARAIWKSSVYQGYNDQTKNDQWQRNCGIWRNQARAALTAAARAKAQALQQISDNIVEKVETRPDHPETAAAQVRERAGEGDIKALVTAALPFAVHGWMDADLEDNSCKLTKHSGPITVGHWRALRTALAPLATEEYFIKRQAEPALIPIYDSTEDQGPDVLGIRKGEE